MHHTQIQTVQKFGGSSVKEAFDNVKSIVSKTAKEEGAVVAIVSAFKGITDKLLKLGIKAEARDKEGVQNDFDELKKSHKDILESKVQDTEVKSRADARLEMLFGELYGALQGCILLRELSPKAKDLIAGFGEQLSGVIVAASLESDGEDVEYVDARQLIKTNDNYGDAVVNFKETNRRIEEYFKDARSKIFVVTGFIASTEKDDTTTLGRGGSDSTGAIFAAALKAKKYQIWKETDGVESADPNLVHGTKTVEKLSFDEMRKLAVAGAKVVHPPAVLPVEEAGIPMEVLNTFHPENSGTTISSEKVESGSTIKAVSSMKDVTIITLKGTGIHEGPGVAERVFASTRKAKANVLMISQATEDAISITVPNAHAEKACKEFNESFAREMEMGAVSMKLVPDQAIVTIVGENMSNRSGVAADFFTAIGNSHVSVRKIAQDADEFSISAVIPQSEPGKKDLKILKKALQVVHDKFILSDRKIVNLFMVGPGRIGKEILKRLQAKKAEHLERYGVEFRLAGVINQTRMLITDNGGIPFEEWGEQLSEAEEANLREFMDRIIDDNLPHSIMVDCTASDEPVAYYPELLHESVAVVTPNKRALSGSHQQYEEIMEAAKSGNTTFGYETNVGAALPVIGPLRDSIAGGDEVQRIDGMLSGTLGYIFSNFDGNKPFSEVVMDAFNEGLTEPNPADDLNLSDVRRKILILAREAGARMELKNVEITPIISEACLKAKDRETFFEELKKLDEQFATNYRIAAAEGKRMRVIERFEKGEASIALMFVGPEHPAYHLTGAKNLVEYTTRDHPNGWQVSGAGAGIGGTANGVIADLMKAAQRS